MKCSKPEAVTCSVHTTGPARNLTETLLGYLLDDRSFSLVRVSSAPSVTKNGVTYPYWGVATYDLRLGKHGQPILRVSSGAHRGRRRSFRLAMGDAMAHAANTGAYYAGVFPLKLVNWSDDYLADLVQWVIAKSAEKKDPQK